MRPGTYLALVHLAVVACLEVSHLVRLLRALEDPGLFLAWGRGGLSYKEHLGGVGPVGYGRLGTLILGDG